MTTEESTDLVVGIDFGMTCTGVAYSNPGQNSVRCIQSWPGKPIGSSNNKVPSSVAYWTEGPNKNRVKCWGFKCQKDDGTKEWFKRYLDPERIMRLKETARKIRARIAEPEIDTLQEDSIPDHNEIKRYYRHYMRCLYNHLKVRIQDKAGNWNSQRVEFIFSLPCTFKRPSIGRTLLNLIKEAGFGSGGKKHTVQLGLTEPEAAAVFTIKESAVGFKAGTTLLVCDAGGGTTDFAVLQCDTENPNDPEFEELDVVEGENVGSTDIDRAFEKMVKSRLTTVTPALPEDTAWFMMHSSDFQAWKCSFGEDDQYFTSFRIPVPGVENDFIHKEAKIASGKMEFSQGNFRALFDPQIEKLITLISTQIERFGKNSPDKILDYIILSGGLGSSPYVKSRLKVKFEGRRDQPELQILVSEEPQLCVVKGLVNDRVQKLRSGKAVLRSRKCRASYGIGINLPYKKEEHMWRNCYIGMNGLTYVEDCIVWLIRKGETIDPDKPLVQKSHRDFLSSDPSRRLKSTIYMSFNDVESLPIESNDHAILVCQIDFDVTNLGLGILERGLASRNFLFNKERRDERFKVPETAFRAPETATDTTLYRVNYETKFIIGAADFRIEIWFHGKKYGEDQHVSLHWA